MLNDKKGLFFQMIMIVGFQIIIFNALITGLGNVNEEPAIAESSQDFIRFNNRIAFNNSVISGYFYSNIYSYFDKFLVWGGAYRTDKFCPKFQGYSVLNGDCVVTSDGVSTELDSIVSSLCEKLFDTSCRSTFDTDSGKVSISGIVKKYNFQFSEFFGDLTYSPFFSFYPGQIVIINFLQDLISELNENCNDISCASTFIPTYSDSVNVVDTVDFFSNLVSNLQKCMRSYDGNCVCFDFDFSTIPTGYTVKFSTVPNGYLVSLYQDSQLLNQDFIYGVYDKIYVDSSKLDYHLLDDIVVKYDGFYYIDVSKQRKISNSKIVFNEGLFFSNSGSSCTSNLFYTSYDSSLSESISRKLGIQSSEINSDFNVFIDVTDKSIQGLPLGSIVVFPSSSFGASKRFSDEIVGKFNEYLKVTPAVVNVFDKTDFGFKPFVVVNISVANKNIFETTDSEFKENLTLAIVNAFRESLDVPLYPNGQMLKMEYAREPYSLKFAMILDDITPPPSIGNLEIIPINYSNNSAYLKFSVMASSDLAGFNVYYYDTSFESVAGKRLQKHVSLNLFSNSDINLANRSKIIPVPTDYRLMQINLEVKETGKNFIYDGEYYLFIDNLLSTDNVAVSTYDFTGNENEVVSSVPLGFDFPKIPVQLGCSPDSLNYMSGNFIFLGCTVSDKTIFGKSVTGVSKRIFGVCGNRDLIFTMPKSDLLALENPTVEAFNSCTDNYYLFVLDDYSGVMLDYKSHIVNLFPSWQYIIGSYGFKVYQLAKSVEGTTEIIKAVSSTY